MYLNRKTTRTSFDSRGRGRCPKHELNWEKRVIRFTVKDNIWIIHLLFPSKERKQRKTSRFAERERILKYIVLLSKFLYHSASRVENRQFHTSALKISARCFESLRPGLINPWRKKQLIKRKGRRRRRKKKKRSTSWKGTGNQSEKKAGESYRNCFVPFYPGHHHRGKTLYSARGNLKICCQRHLARDFPALLRRPVPTILTDTIN